LTHKRLAGSSGADLAGFAAGLLLIPVGSVAWLVPIRRTLESGTDLPATAVDGLRARWRRGHLIRTAVPVALFALTVVATIV
jgi:Domain of unknown function (DUF1772)